VVELRRSVPVPIPESEGEGMTAKFFEVYNDLKRRDPDCPEEILYMCTMEELDAPCEHPWRLRLRVETRYFQDPTEFVVSEERVLSRWNPATMRPPRFSWCPVCNTLIDRDNPPPPVYTKRRRAQYLGAILRQVVSEEDGSEVIE
jgi:hypothetical protein